MARTHETLTSLFSDIADSIREKTGDTESIVADEFPEAIANIPSGGEENLAEEMEIMDMNIKYYYTYRPISSKDYSDKYVAELTELINKLGGN